jgi:hypothetical protein
MMLNIAYQVFPDIRERILECAVLAGRVTWEKGLILKGPGICHGITGNGYALHCLSRLFTSCALNTDDEIE